MFGEFNEMVLYHSVLIKVMLGVLVAGMVIPFLSRECPKTVKRLRIYMFFSHGLLSMIAFSGLIAYVFADLPMTLSMMAMIVIFFAMIMIEVVKYKKVLKNQQAENCATYARVTVSLYSVINIALIAVMVVWKVMEQ